MKTQRIILIGIAAGIVSSWLKSLVEAPLEKLGLEYFPSSKEELELKGADLISHPENMPPAIMLKKVFCKLTGNELKDTVAIKMMPYIHYTLGTGLAMSYVLLRNKNKNVSVLQGFPAGFIIFSATHGSLVPALGLQDDLRKMPKSWWVWEFGSHLLFGFFVEQSTKLFKKII
ncbi:MAG: DUF1440 domain-containing protein [Chryseobacterium sp.]|nr:DUF1440 domain-containing protein [Chryseobacterium sp.]